MFKIYYKDGKYDCVTTVDGDVMITEYTRRKTIADKIFNKIENIANKIEDKFYGI